ncbi:MAG TPA: terminase family protein [Stellaceae bacterium]|nr:terminase family protein [Stellaceae bacterium]
MTERVRLHKSVGEQGAREVFGRIADALERDWTAICRPSQRPPPGNWTIWLLLAGRGFGKTRAGAEWIRTLVETGAAKRVALVAPTAADARDVMIEGESGLLSIAPKWDRPQYEPSKRRLTWPSGAVAHAFSADEPERLRGPQFDFAWCDELCAWRYPSAWDNLMLALRLGRHPRVAVTTTPKPVRLLRDLLKRDGKDVVVRRGSTRENAENLAPAFLAEIMGRYEGTRLGRQELEAELLEDTPGAFWNREQLERCRIESRPEELARVVVAIDPAGGSEPGNDETGIIVAGIDARGHGFVLDDLSGRYRVEEWARKAIGAYKRFNADRIVAETNFGGQMVEATLRTVDPTVSFKAVSASRGKVVRAEPVAALYEQGKISHVGAFPNLEDQMAAFGPDFSRSSAGYSPDRVDALCWALTELLQGPNLQPWVDHFQSMAENKGAIQMPESKPIPTSIAAAWAGLAAPKAPPEVKTVTLRAEPHRSFKTPKGVLYCSDATGLVANVAPEHVEILINAGCWPIQEAP